MICLIEAQVYSLGIERVDELAEASSLPLLLQEQRSFYMSILVWLHVNHMISLLCGFVGYPKSDTCVCSAFPPHSGAGHVEPYLPLLVGSAEISQSMGCQRREKTALEKEKERGSYSFGEG